MPVAALKLTVFPPSKVVSPDTCPCALIALDIADDAFVVAFDVTVEAVTGVHLTGSGLTVDTAKGWPLLELKSIKTGGERITVQFASRATGVTMVPVCIDVEVSPD